MYLAKVYITLKPTVNDPQGLTVRGGLHTLGFKQVTSVRVGKYIELKIEGNDLEQAKQQVAQMCQKLLANTVIEKYNFELEKISQ